ncbi:MAG TPA: lysylphosphatidylglycerol synthase transmembrane domain-containing protein [Bryobacteraceae bacterium]|nr:lysylphosphatidylglycerol synthase transmembrane domain-containing protein [Bryobacteraceae bacterium]
MKEPGKRRWWAWAVSLALAGILLWLALRGTDWRHLWRIIAGAQPRFLAAAAALTCLSYFIRAARWRILLNAETHLRLAPVFWANMAGYLGNTLLPARAGELIRSFLISSRSSLGTAYVLTTAIGERLMDAIALVLWSGVLLARVEPKPLWLSDVSRSMALAGAAGLLVVLALPHTECWLRLLIRRAPLPASFRQRLEDWSSQVLLGLRAFHDFGRFAAFTLMTAGIWLLDAVATITGAEALGLHFSFPVAMLLIAGMGLGSSLPSTPGYVGIYQFVAVSVLTPFGIDQDAALAYIFVAQALGAGITLLFGFPGLCQAQALGASGQRGAQITMRSTSSTEISSSRRS